MIKLNTFQSLCLSGVHFVCVCVQSREKADLIPKQITRVWTWAHVKHLLFLSACLFRVFIKNIKNPLSVQSSLNIQQPLWTGNASSLWRVMLSTAVKILSLCVFLSHAHTLVVVYLCQVKQYPCLPMSWMLALMCSSYCGHCASSTLLWPIRRKRGLPAGSCSGGPWPERPLPL